MPDTEFKHLLARSDAITSISSREHAREIRRLLLLMRREGKEKRRVIKRYRRDNIILDSFYPLRKTEWQFSWNRTSSRRIKLANFSFIDNPVGTMQMLYEICKSECDCSSLKIDFIDDHVTDVSSFMTLGLIKESMLPIVSGGKISERIREVVRATALEEFLGMRKLGKIDTTFVYPFKLRTRRGSGKSTSDNRSTSATTEEKTQVDFADTVDGWLMSLQKPQKLSAIGRSNILELLSEVLDNAKRHSDPVHSDGSWHMAGFMEVRFRPDESPIFVCHLAIISVGSTIFESLQRGPAETRRKLENYSARHRRSFLPADPCAEEALWTALSLQDGVSRVPVSPSGSPGGFGMMTLVDMINALGGAPDPSEWPRLTLISGNSCVMVRDHHRMFQRGPEGHRIIAFNEANDLDQPPDPAYVHTLPYRFPGTIVSIRFYLDPTNRSERPAKDAQNA